MHNQGVGDTTSLGENYLHPLDKKENQTFDYPQEGIRLRKNQLAHY